LLSFRFVGDFGQALNHLGLTMPDRSEGRWKLLANLWHPDKIDLHSKETATRRLSRNK